MLCVSIHCVQHHELRGNKIESHRSNPRSIEIARCVSYKLRHHRFASPCAHAATNPVLPIRRCKPNRPGRVTDLAPSSFPRTEFENRASTCGRRVRGFVFVAARFRATVPSRCGRHRIRPTPYNLRRSQNVRRHRTPTSPCRPYLWAWLESTPEPHHSRGT